MSSATPLSVSPQIAASSTAAEKKIYEPSMEEILASIRRIIADDQSLPGRGAASETFASPLTPHAEAQARIEQIELGAAEAPPATVVPAEIGRAAPPTPHAHGSVAAPQFASHPVAAPPDTPSDAPAPSGPGPSAAYPPPFAAEPTAPRVSGLQPVPPASAESIGRDAANDPDALASEGDGLDYDAPIMPEEAFADPTHDTESPASGVLASDQTDYVPASAGAGLFSAATDSSVASAFNMLAASRLADNSDGLMNLAREMIRPLLRTWIDDNLPSMVERMVRAEIERVARGGR